ncbi:hypothetical protein BaRGS_00025031, partial [Batillaria attramentaria]
VGEKKNQTYCSVVGTRTGPNPDPHATSAADEVQRWPSGSNYEYTQQRRGSQGQS